LKEEGKRPWTELLKKKSTRSSFYEKEENLEKEILRIHGDGRKLSNIKISKEANTNPIKVAKILKKNNLKSWDSRNKWNGKGRVKKSTFSKDSDRIFK
jgi:hypothetical protein